MNSFMNQSSSTLLSDEIVNPTYTNYSLYSLLICKPIYCCKSKLDEIISAVMSDSESDMSQSDGSQNELIPDTPKRMASKVDEMPGASKFYESSITVVQIHHSADKDSSLDDSTGKVQQKFNWAGRSDRDSSKMFLENEIIVSRGYNNTPESVHGVKNNFYRSSSDEQDESNCITTVPQDYISDVFEQVDYSKYQINLQKNLTQDSESSLECGSDNEVDNNSEDLNEKIEGQPKNVLENQSVNFEMNNELMYQSNTQTEIEVEDCSVQIQASSSSVVEKKPEIPHRIIKNTLVFENKMPIHSKYIIREKIGEGTFGSVHVASERLTGIRRAVKKMLKKPGHLNKREIAIMKTLDHPNIVKLYETFEDSTNIYLVLEYCRGGELFDRLKDKIKFSEKEAARYTYQMLSAISYLHSRNIVHRDLKLENFLFLSADESSSMKLIDFGFAKFYKTNDFLTTTVGTVYYVSPEVLNGCYNEKCDLWSIGVILYILLCGRPPFNGPDDPKIIKQIKKGVLNFPSELWRDISDLAKDLIQQLLNINLCERLSAKEAMNHEWFQMFSQLSLTEFVIPRPISTPGCLNKALKSPYLPRSASYVNKMKNHCCELSFIGIHSALCRMQQESFKKNSISKTVTFSSSKKSFESNNTSQAQLQCWKNLASQLIIRWKRFATYNQLKKAAFRVIAQQLPDGDTEIQPLRQLFFVLDSGKDGILTCDEVAAGIEAIQSATSTKLPKNLSHYTLNEAFCSSSYSFESCFSFPTDNKDVDKSAPEEELSTDFLRNLISAVSLEKNNVLEYSDFIAASIDLKDYLKEDILKAAFSVFDRDNNGLIDPYEVRALLTWYKNCGSSEPSHHDDETMDEEIRNIIDAWDHDRDGSINYKDFVISLKTDESAITSEA